MSDLEEATCIVRLLKKEHEYGEYLEKKWELEYEEKRKLEKQKNNQKGKVKKLGVVKEKAA